MRKTLIIILILISFQPQIAKANLSFTQEEVANHDTPSDCYMIFDNKVYNVTKDRLQFHDTKYLDIDDWCGKDITRDFKAKDEEGRDHIPSSYSLLDQYYIGELVTIETKNIDSTSDSNINSSSKISSRYNIVVPIIGMSILFIITRTLKNKKKSSGDTILSGSTYKFIWNTILIISLIPSGVFGIFMVLRTKFPELYSIKFDVLFWHVEGGILLFIGILLHLLDRLTTYFAQFKSIRKKK